MHFYLFIKQTVHSILVAKNQVKLHQPAETKIELYLQWIRWLESSLEEKVDMLYIQQRLKYGCCECGRFDGPTKEMNDGRFKMIRVLKDMLYRFYQSAPSTVHDLVLPCFLLFGK